MKFGVLLTLVLATRLLAADVGVLHLEPAVNMDRADLCYLTHPANPRALLILCPGVNASGEGFVRSPAWQEFAQSNNLGLVGLSFASPEKTLKDGIGYYYASKGSGEKLLSGLRLIYGKDLPLFLYGFSGGAHFTSRFEEWKPERVLAWCADSAGWWDTPLHNFVNPPGIVACGDQDPRYGATISYFKQGRAVGKAWAWISLPKLGHQRTPALDDFVRKYFEAILDGSISTNLSRGVWVDVDTKKLITPQEADIQPCESVWLPTPQLFDDWRKIHEP